MERPELYHKYNNKVKWRYMVCPVGLLLGKSHMRWCCQHHVDRKRNSNRCIWCCSNENPKDIVYKQTCHDWIHKHPEEADKLGLYNKLTNSYNKKKSKSSKWKINKKPSPAKKWKLDK